MLTSQQSTAAAKRLAGRAKETVEQNRDQIAAYEDLWLCHRHGGQALLLPEGAVLQSPGKSQVALSHSRSVSVAPRATAQPFQT